MSFETAKAHLKKYNLESKIIEFEESSATVSEAAKLLNCRDAEIAKTLGFIVEDKPILILMAGDRKVDNNKFKIEFSTKAKMIPHEEVYNLIGHEVGGVCPFGINEGIDVYLDESLKEFDMVYPACGSHNSAVKLSLKDLEVASEYKKWIDVSKKQE